MDKKDELRLIETHEMQISKHFAVNFNKTLIYLKMEILLW